MPVLCIIIIIIINIIITRYSCQKRQGAEYSGLETPIFHLTFCHSEGLGVGQIPT